MVPLRIGLAAFFVSVADAELYDVLQPHLLPPAEGCKLWSDAPQYDKYWRNITTKTLAKNYCAQQGKGNPDASWDPDMGTGATAHTVASYCVGKTTNKVQRCSSGKGIPEQVNVQIASGDSVVVNFVTYENSDPTSPPVVMNTATGKSFNGVTHKHNPCTSGKACTGGPYKPRTLYMHFVRLSGLTPRSTFEYKVKSGGAGSVWSDTFKFRTPYSSADGGPTRIALYGDMGVYSYNNMQNLYEETTVNETADLILHAGDHCYNEGDDDEARADAYMQAFEKTTANSLWMPIVGNHEFYAGTNLTRYLDQTWEKWGPLPGGEEWGHSGEGLSGATSATSALGALLATGNHHGPGVHAKVPSKTSRYFSVDFGLTHLVALSLNGYNGVDLCTDKCNKEQVEWLKQDLAAVDRSKTPWVIAMSHFPMYLSVPEFGSDKPADPGTAPFGDQAWFTSEQCEYEGHNKNCTWSPEEKAARKKKARGDARYGTGIKPSANADLEPIFYEYGVDIYWAGHIHFYNRFDGPIYKGKVVSKGTHNPAGTLHSCTGNGGPPSPSKCTCADKKECVTCIGQPYSYTRLTVHNATDLLWEQVSNADSSIIDTWSVHQEKHGKFPVPPA